MKIGADDKKKMGVALGLVSVAIILLVRMLFSSGESTPVATPSSPLVAPVATPAPRVAAKGRNAKGRVKKVAGPRSLDPTLRFDWLKASEDTKYEGNGRNIFMAQADIPEPIKNGTTDHNNEAVDQGPPQPPPPPPINLKFFGFASKAGEPKRIFLSQGEDVFIAEEGQIIDRHYKIVKISPTSVEIEDVLNNNRQSIPLTQG